MWISEASKYTFRRRASKKSQEKKERRVLPSKEGKKKVEREESFTQLFSRRRRGTLAVAPDRDLPATSS